MNKDILRESIRRMVKEAIQEMRNTTTLQEADEKSKNDSKRKFVTNTLNQNDNDKFDHAHLAYRLWPNKDKDSARSYFSKCLKGDRQFSDKDVTKLYNMLSSK